MKVTKKKGRGFERRFWKGDQIVVISLTVIVLTVLHQTNYFEMLGSNYSYHIVAKLFQLDEHIHAPSQETEQKGNGSIEIMNSLVTFKYSFIYFPLSWIYAPNVVNRLTHMCHTVCDVIACKQFTNYVYSEIHIVNQRPTRCAHACSFVNCPEFMTTTYFGMKWMIRNGKKEKKIKTDLSQTLSSVDSTAKNVNKQRF